MIRLQVHGKRVQDFSSLVNAYSAGELASPTRSTVPLVDYWRAPADRLTEFCKAFDCATTGECELSFEFATRVRHGRGKSSYTDLMITADDAVLAVEGKFTEPRYEMVSQWLRKSADENRSQVLSGWLEIIESATLRAISPQQISTIPYQLIHRTASACSVDRQRRLVVYQVFAKEPNGYYKEELSALHQLIGVPEVAFAIVSTPAIRTPFYQDLCRRWDAGERRMGEAVKNALKAGPLLEFGKRSVTRIT